MAMDSATSPFQLRTTTGPTLRVLSFTGREAMNELYQIDLVVAASEGDEANAASALLGAQGVLTIDIPGNTPRSIAGIVASLATEGPHERGAQAFRVRLVPRLYLLDKHRTSRIFQDKTAREIADIVLDRYPIARTWRLSGQAPKRSYCVQYEETDLAFVRRILAEEGIFFFFEQPSTLADDPAQGELLTLADAPELYATIPGNPELAYRYQSHAGAGLTLEERHVTYFSTKSSIEPTSVLLRDFDFTRPTLDLRSTSSGAPPPNGVDLRYYDHHGEYEEPSVAQQNAVVCLEQLRRGAEEQDGASVCRRLLPGHRFSLIDHSFDTLNRGYVVTRVEHRGVAPGIQGGDRPAYECRFSAVPEEVPYRPERPVRIARQVVETAFVVGPQGEEIYTDGYGRVKVQFHWDLEGERNEHSSCWLRVLMPWAGAGFGFQFIPRIGMEVVVTFLGGDLDRPVVSGCVYDAVNPVPHILPGNTPRSGIRTRSTPGSDGFNEIAFDDRAGAEQVYLRAQRNLDELVIADHATDVGGSQQTKVRFDQTTLVQGGRAVTVEGGQTVNVKGPSMFNAASIHAVNVGEDMTIAVGRNRIESVTGIATCEVKGQHITRVSDDHALHVQGTSSIHIGDENKRTGGEIYAFGSYTVGAGETVRIRAEQTIILECGTSTVIIGPDEVKIDAKTITLSAASQATMRSNGPALNLGDQAEIVAKSVSIYSSGASLALDDEAALRGKKATLASGDASVVLDKNATTTATEVKLYSADKASVELDKNASMKGALVMLNCKGDGGQGPEGKDAPKQEGEELSKETKPLELRLTDPLIQPYKDKKYVLVVGGKRFEGTTDGDGKLKHDVPKDAEAGSVTVWLGDYPEGERASWKLRIEDLPEASTVPGALSRLMNLGYYLGPQLGAMDEALRAALLEFQTDHKLALTGELDGPTVEKLTETHGH